MSWNSAADGWGTNGDRDVVPVTATAAWDGGKKPGMVSFVPDPVDVSFNRIPNGGKNGFGGTDDGNDGDGGDDRTCDNCGQPGHNIFLCTNPRVFIGECRHCKQEGHMHRDCPSAPPPRCGNCRKEGHYIDDCPDPLVCPRCQGSHKVKDCTEPMKCRHCEGEHMAKECPTYVPTCNNCGETEHTINECKNPRKIDRSHLPDMSIEEAWKLLEQAINERDMDEVKEKIQIYLKAQPTITFVDLEMALRSQGYGLYLIPLAKAHLAVSFTNMDLQGNLGKKYTVNYRFSDKPRRQTEKDGWPKDHDEIMARLADAGDVVPRGKPKCSNCSELGHIFKNCPQDKMEADRVVVMCYNCGEEGHRVRDCPTPRVDKFACKNCGKSGHKIADCSEPRSAEGVECRKCNEKGHFSKDCPTAEPRLCRNCGGEGHMAKECTEPRKMQCRNCDEYGHTGKECSKPRDMSRVKCQNCQEMGHFKFKCPNPHVPEDGGDAGDIDNNGAHGDMGGDSWTPGTVGGW